jgi:hypothetical protein
VAKSKKAKHLKTTVGISIDGRDIHVVKLVKKRKGLELVKAEHLKLLKSLDAPEVPQEAIEDIEPETVFTQEDLDSIDITDSDDGVDLAELGFEEDEEKSNNDSGTFVKILQMAQEKDAKITISITEPKVYNYIYDSDWGLKGKQLKKKILGELGQEKESYKKLKSDNIGKVKLANDRLMVLAREGRLEIYEQFKKVKQYVDNGIPTIAFTESIEISLSNFVINQYDLQDKTTTLIIYVASDNSKFIFLEGNKIHHLSQTIPEGSDSPYLAGTLYSRLLFELDTLDLPQLDNIFLSGHAYSSELNDLLVKNFSIETRIESLSPNKIALSENDKQLSSTMSDTGLPDEFTTGADDQFSEGLPTDLSPYSVALGGAIRAMSHDPHHEMINIDLTPAKIKEFQNKYMMSVPGWIMAGLVPIIAVLAFLQIDVLIDKESDLNWELLEKNSQLAIFETIQAEIIEAEAQLANYERSFSVIDSLVIGTNTWSTFFERMSFLSSEIGGFWLTDLASIEDDKALLTGYSVLRHKIPMLVDSLYNANLNSVEVQEIRKRKVYHFVIETNLPE